MSERTCKVCDDTMPLEAFTPIIKVGKVYYSWTCKMCRNDLLWRNNYSVKVRAANRKFNKLVSWPPADTAF